MCNLIFRSQKPEARSQKPEARSQKPEARSQKPEARSQKINILRGIAIFLVIVGHSLQKTNCGNVYESIWKNPVYLLIYTFHMPLFMVISGYLTYTSLQRKSTTDFFKNRIYSLLKYIVVWGTFHVVMRAVNGKFSFNVSELISDYTDALWFLWAVLVCSIILLLIDRKLKNNRVIGYLLGFFLALVSPIPSKTVFMYPFFLLGYIIGKNKSHISTIYNHLIMKPIYIFFLAIMYAGSYFVLLYSGMSKEFTLHISSYKTIVIDLLRYFSGVTGTFFMYYLMDRLMALSHSCFFKVWEKLGDITLEIYVLNIVVLEDLYGDWLVPTIWSIYDRKISPLLFNCISVVIAILLIFLLYLLTNFIKKSSRLNNFLFRGR